MKRVIKYKTEKKYNLMGHTPMVGLDKYFKL